jgi:hypothetical protein
VALLEQRLHKVRADEAGRAGHDRSVQRRVSRRVCAQACIHLALRLIDAPNVRLPPTLRLRSTR